MPLSPHCKLLPLDGLKMTTSRPLNFWAVFITRAAGNSPIGVRVFKAH
jgi:hypothetical protein